MGTIKDFVKEKGTGFYNVDINFSTEYNKLEFVYIIRNFFKIEQNKLLDSIQNQKEHYD